jgi:cyanate lyase
VSDPRQIIVQAAEGRGLSLASLSRMIGRNAAYVQQFVDRGSPRRLPEDERRLLAMALDLDERKLGARDPWTPPVSRRAGRRA